MADTAAVAMAAAAAAAEAEGARRAMEETAAVLGMRRVRLQWMECLQNQSKCHCVSSSEACARRHGQCDSTGFSPRICRIFPSEKIRENEGNIRYLSGKIL